MIKRLWAATLAVAVLFGGGVASAQDFDGNANMNLHITAASYGGCADAQYDVIDAGTCTLLASSSLAGPAFVWVVVSRTAGFPSIGGAQFGVTHGGVTGWTLCTGGSEIPETGWPDSGTGNAVTWGGGCYTPVGANAKVGFYSVNDGAANMDMAVVQDARINDALWADCGAPPDVPPTEFSICLQNLGSANLSQGTTPNCSDNCTVPTVESSWGRIKSLF